MTRTVLLTLALASLTTTAVTAQARRADRPPRTGVEDLLRLRTQLELTPEQVTRLQALREEALARRIATATEMMRLRSQVAAGEITREQFQVQLRTRREAARARMQEGTQERPAELLTETQRAKLQEFRREVRRERVRHEMRSRREAVMRERRLRRFEG
jgi:hypothetical protein